MKSVVFFAYIFAFLFGTGCSGADMADFTPIDISEVGNVQTIETTKGAIIGRNPGFLVPYYDERLDLISEYWLLGEKIWPEGLVLTYEVRDKFNGRVQKKRFDRSSFSRRENGEYVRGELSIIFRTKDFLRFANKARWEAEFAKMGQTPKGVFYVSIGQSISFLKNEKYHVSITVDRPAKTHTHIYFVTSEMR